MNMKRYDLPGPMFLPVGRHGASETACAMWWPGSGARVRAACRAMEAEIEAPAPASGHMPWLAVTADGAPIARLPLMPGTHRYPVLSGMDPECAYDIALTRDTQPAGDEAGPVLLRAVWTDGELAPSPRRPLTLEFIGDSLTVGEGCLGPKRAMDWRMPWISNAPAFPSLVCERLNAEKRVVAMGGWGCWRAYDGDGSHRIGLIYDSLCGVTPGGELPYAFDPPADAVVIGLGTNDASALALLPEAARAEGRQEIRAYALALIEQVRRHNPEAAILWCYGMLGDALAPTLRGAVEAARQAGDARVGWLQLSDFGGDFGAREHPSREAHRRASGEIARALEDMLR